MKSTSMRTAITRRVLGQVPFLLAATFVAISAATASASVIVADDFDDKTTGDLAGQGGGYNASGSWTSNWTGSTNFDVNAGGRVHGLDGNTYRSFSGATVNQVLYVGVTMQATGADTGYFAAIKVFDQTAGGGTPQYTNTVGLRDVQFGLNASKVSPGLTQTEFNDAQWRFVLKIIPNETGTTDRYQVWVDDVSDSSFDKTEASTKTFNSAGSFFGDVALDVIGIIGAANNNTRYYDDLIVATTFEEAATFAIPEPATGLLLGAIAALALVGWRRR